MKTGPYAAAILAGSAILAAAAPASAHHSYAMFDRTKQATYEGTVKEFQWTNPHAWIQVMIPDPTSGAEVEWGFELGGTQSLVRRGWTRTSLKPGDKVVITANPRRDGHPGGGMITGTVNGQPLDRAPPPG